MISIPRIIHQTYKSLDLPEKWAHVPDAWKKHHPTWEYKFWSDDDIYNFIDSQYSDYSQFFRNLPYHIQRVDMVRYFLLYHYGGIYSDMDIEPVKSLDHLFKTFEKVDKTTTNNTFEKVDKTTTNNTFEKVDKTIENSSSPKTYLLRSPNKKCITNMLMASTSHNPFWLEVIDEIVNIIDSGSYRKWVEKHLIVLNTTGPGMLDSVVQKTKLPIVLLPSALLFPSECAMGNKRPCSTPDSLVKHLDGSSWISPTANFMSHLYTKRYFPLLIILLVLMIFAIVFSIGYFIGNRTKSNTRDIKVIEKYSK